MTKTLVGPQWPEPVRILSEITSEYGFITVEAVGLTSGRHYSTVLWPGQMPAAATAWRPDFSADADVWRLLIEAERLKLAYACDPLVATNNCLVDLLPHQLEAVYDVMLPQPIRTGLANSAANSASILSIALALAIAFDVASSLIFPSSPRMISPPRRRT